MRIAVPLTAIQPEKQLPSHANLINPNGKVMFSAELPQFP